MRNPYEVLEIKEGASLDEIKNAYRELAKKYHPDKYVNNPLQDLAEEKMREINEAYNYLMKNAENNSQYRNQNSYNTYSEQNTYSSYTSPNLQNVRNMLNNNNIMEAERVLRDTPVKNAEWYFLRGVISLRKNFYSQGYEDIQRAVNMDPNNFEYRETLNKLNMNNMNYNNYSYARRGNSNNDFCEMCTCLLCTDQCCECSGGDLIPCC